MTRVIKTRLVDGGGSLAAPPGTVLERDDDSLQNQCGDRPLLIHRWQPEPDSA